MRPGLLGLEDAKEKVEVWRGHYNDQPPHSSLGYQSPAKYHSGALPTPSSSRPGAQVGRKPALSSRRAGRICHDPLG